MVKNKKSNNKQWLTVVVISLLILAMIGIGVWVSKSSDAPPGETPKSASQEEYSPPTEEEVQSGDTVKDTVIANDKKDNTTVNSPAGSANVIITDAGQYGDVIEVRAFISNVYLDGTCTITFSKEDLKVTKQTPAYRDASTTICTNPEIHRSEFPKGGEWQLRVQYDANSSSGTSETKIVVIE